MNADFSRHSGRCFCYRIFRATLNNILETARSIVVRFCRETARPAAWLLVMGTLSASPALAFDPVYPFADPLGTSPEVLETGATLPGERTPIACPVPKDFSQPLILDEAVDLALCNNPQVKSSWANIKIQAGVAGEARATYLPVLTGALGRTNDQIRYSNPLYPSSNIDRNTAQGTLTWRLLDFGGRDANRQSAEHLLSAALASHNATLQKVLTEAIGAYCDALTARAWLSAKTENMGIANITLNSAKTREKNGAVAQSDTLQAATALAKASLEKNRAQGQYEKALSVLKYVLGVQGNPTITLPVNLDEKFGEDVGKELHAWLEEAQKKHPALLAARSQVEAARQRVEATRTASMPSLGFSANFYQNTRPGEAVTFTEAKETTVGLMLTVPIFDGFSSTYKLQGAKAQVEQKEALLVDTEQHIAMEVIKSHADATSALQNLEASAILLKTAQNAQAVSRRKYDKGAADIIELLNTQAALTDAWQERIRCLAEWRSASLRLLASSGQMGRVATGN